jgi:hypothetical protein
MTKEKKHVKNVVVHHFIYIANLKHTVKNVVVHHFVYMIN